MAALERLARLADDAVNGYLAHCRRMDAWERRRRRAKQARRHKRRS